MTDSYLFMLKIAESGLELSNIAQKLHISLKLFISKIHNKRAFLASEMQILCDLLDITDSKEKVRIFFANGVEVNSTVKK